MQFERTIGIDYSGAGEPSSHQEGIRAYITEGGGMANEEYLSKSNPNLAWTRPDLAKRLINILDKGIKEGTQTIVGIDHAFSFPKRYFEKYKLKPNWDKFLADFHNHWPTDEYPVHSLRTDGNGNPRKDLARRGRVCWFRETEEWCNEAGYSAKSVFLFARKKYSVRGQVATSTHAGLPFLLQIRNSFPKSKLHVWPFDGWKVPQGKSCLVEAYPSLYVDDYKKDKKCPQKPELPKKDRTWKDRRDAYAVAMWLRDMDNDKGELQSYLDLESQLPKEALERAKYEGWIIGTPKIEE